MATVVYIDGVRVASERASVSVFDRGFLHGDSVFESLRTYWGRPLLLGRHLVRLERSARSIGFALPVALSELAAEVQCALRDAGTGERAVRVTVTRGTGEPGLDPTTAVQPTRVIAVRDAPPLQRSLDECVQIQTMARSMGRGHTAEAKHGSGLVGVLATARARGQGAAEAIWISPRGDVLEGASSNVFVVQGRRVVTPPTDGRILAGVTRGRVLEIAPNVGCEALETSVSDEQLRTADEVFLTSALRGIVPVGAVDDVVIAGGRPGVVTRALWSAFLTRALQSDSS